VEDCFEPEEAVTCSAGTEPAAVAVYCAYHGNIPVGEGELVYSNDPYVTGNFGCEDGNHPNGSTSDGVIQGGLSHEHNESLTDPEPNNAWTDWGGMTGEIGDKCRGGEAAEFGPPLGTAANGASYNQLVNGHLYWYQQEWSNQGHRCMQRLTFSGSEPVATFTSKPLAGGETSFDAGGSTAPGGVFRYGWQFNDGSKPVETTSQNVAHKLAGADPHLVALTVFAKDGTSIGTARTIEGGNVVTPPTLVTGAASGVTPGTATLNATVNPNSREVSECRFEYGPTESYGSSAPCSPPPGAGAAPVAVSASVTGLTASTLYHFRIHAATHLSKGNGGDRTFTTLPSQPQEESGPPTGGGVTPPTPVPAPVPAPVPVSLPAPAPGEGTLAFTSTLPPPSPVSDFAILSAKVNTRTGTITFTASVNDPGSLSWLVTLQNGRFGVFKSSASKCGSGLVNLGGRCRQARIVFARGSRFFAAAGAVSFNAKPSATATKALRNALRQRKGIPVIATLTFQSSLGGTPVSHQQSLTARLRK
jgi:hypothetical protein